jgi:hypothetical protein
VPCYFTLSLPPSHHPFPPPFPAAELVADFKGPLTADIVKAMKPPLTAQLVAGEDRAAAVLGWASQLHVFTVFVGIVHCGHTCPHMYDHATLLLW